MASAPAEVLWPQCACRAGPRSQNACSAPFPAGTVLQSDLGFPSRLPAGSQMSAQLPPTAGRHSKETGGDGGSRGPSRLQTIAWIAATGVLLAGGGLALLTHHPHQPGRPAGCGLVSCSATIPVTQPPAPVRPPSPSASTRPSVTRANFPPRAAASARASISPRPRCGLQHPPRSPGFSITSASPATPAPARETWTAAATPSPSRPSPRRAARRDR